MPTAPELPTLSHDDRNSRQGSMSSRAYDALRQAIVQMHFGPGSLLSEAEIARQLGISRQPVREAMIRLGQEGLVEVRPQRGTFVRLISVREVENARFIREAIEVAIVRRCAAMADDADIARLENIIDDQRTAAARGENAAFLRHDEAFHQTIATVAGCQDTWRVLQGLKAQLDRVRYLSMPDATPPLVIIDQHSRIARAIAAHDPEEAANTMHQHLSEILKALPALALAHPARFTE